MTASAFPPPVPAPPKGRSEGLRIALIAAATGLAAAGLGGVVTLVGMKLQSDTQAEQSRENFAREQRQTAYASVLARSATVLDSWSAVNDAAGEAVYTGSVEGLTKYWTLLEPEFDASKAEFGLVRLIGSEAVQESLTCMSSQYQGIEIAFDSFLNDENEGVVWSGGEFEPFFSRAVVCQNDFIDAARTDQLGAD